MARKDNGMSAKDTKGGTRLGARLDNDTSALLELLAFATGLTPGQLIPTALLSFFDTLPKNQRDTIQRAMGLRNGSIGKLRKSCGQLSVKNEELESPDTGAGDRSDENTSNRLNTISRIHQRSTNPLDKAISVQYGEE